MSLHASLILWLAMLAEVALATALLVAIGPRLNQLMGQVEVEEESAK